MFPLWRRELQSEAREMAAMASSDAEGSEFRVYMRRQDELRFEQLETYAMVKADAESRRVEKMMVEMERKRKKASPFTPWSSLRILRHFGDKQSPS